MSHLTVDQKCKGEEEEDYLQQRPWEFGGEGGDAATHCDSSMKFCAFDRYFVVVEEDYAKKYNQLQLVQLCYNQLQSVF